MDYATIYDKEHVLSHSMSLCRPTRISFLIECDNFVLKVVIGIFQNTELLYYRMHNFVIFFYL